ncbi:hypothetical protein ACPPVU_20625 [Mucilaginibacter sp. McL0603]|uniref:hypothetical protein n=1 Tax=Mucilaginibacter sp. McL0603 TaxID=3415670 RepID=UPI003CF0384B
MMMEQEFTISKGLKIVYSALAIFLAGFAFFLFSLDNSKAGPVGLLIPIFLLIFAFIIIVNQVRSKVIISDISITRISVFSNKELLFTEIEGCRIGQKVIYIEPVSPLNSKITINNYIDLRDSDELVKWLKEHFTDLDAVDLSNEQNRLLQNQDLGLTEEDRTEKLSRAKQIAIAYNIVGFALGFIILLLKNNYLAAILGILCPLAGIIVMIFSKGLIKFVSDSKRSIYPWIVLGFMTPVITMLIKSIGDYSIFRYNHFWLPFILGSCVIFILLIAIGLNKSIKSVVVQVVFMLIISIIYTYGATLQANCAFDNSKPIILQTTVVGKFFRHSKGTDYYLTISPWKDGPQPQDISVSYSIYEKTTPGSLINVSLKRGTLNIPWFYIDK